MVHFETKDIKCCRWGFLEELTDHTRLGKIRWAWANRASAQPDFYSTETFCQPFTVCNNNNKKKDGHYVLEVVQSRAACKNKTWWATLSTKNFEATVSSTTGLGRSVGSAMACIAKKSGPLYSAENVSNVKEVNIAHMPSSSKRTFSYGRQVSILFV